MLVEERPSAKFLGELKQAGFALPEFIEIAGKRIDSASNLLQRKLGGLRPWAWGPDSVEVLRPLFGKVGRESRTPEQWFNENVGEFCSKVWSAELRSVLAGWGAESWLCTEFETGRRVTTLTESLRVIAAIRQAGHHRVVVKQALGLAGQNALRLWEPEVSEAQKRVDGKGGGERTRTGCRTVAIARSGFFPFVTGLQDGLRLRGFTGLWNDERGQFQGNFVQPGYRRNIPREIIQLLGHASYIPKIRALYGVIFSVLEQRLKAAGHFSPVPELMRWFIGALMERAD